MTQTQKGMLLAAVLVGAVIVWGRNVRRSSPPQRPVVEQAQAGRASSAPEGVHVAKAPIRRMFAVNAALLAKRADQRRHAAVLVWGRDPFTRGSAQGHLNGLLLSGILWDAQAPMAIINGSMVHVGEEIEGYRVSEITQDHVILSDGVQTFQVDIAR